MATLTGNKIQDTYKDLLQVSNSNSGIDGTLRTVSDGEGTDSAFRISTNKSQIKPSFNGVDTFEVVDSSGTAVLRVDTDSQIVEVVNGIFKGDQAQLEELSSTTELAIIADSDADGSTGTDDLILQIGSTEILRVPNSARSITSIGATPYLKRKHISWLNTNGFNINTDDLIVPHQALPGNYAIMDKNGNYHWCVEIARKNWDPTSAFASSTIHPAFIVNGSQRRIFIGKFQVSQNSSSQYVTHAGRNIKHTISFDDMLAAIAALNNGSDITGFHMITNAEWALIAILCKYYSQMPYGNNNYGRDIDDKAISGQFEAGSTAVFGTSSGDGARWLAGSGGILTSHNRSESGIYDMNGNVWEWVGGLRLNAGEINILENNNAADYTKDQSASSTEWKAILTDGTLVSPGTAETLKLDASSPGSVVTTIVNQDADPDSSANTFETQTTALSGAGIELLKKIATHPHTTELNNDYIYFRNYLERLPIRGGSWYNGSGAGVFSLYLNNFRSNAYNNIGSRVAYVL